MKSLKIIAGKLSPFLIGGIGCFVAWYCVHVQWISLKDSLAGLQRSAFVMAGFIVAAFNLRFKLVDALTGSFFNSGEMERMRGFFKKCRFRLERYILIFLITAVYMSMSPLAGETGVRAMAVSILGWGLFLYCATGYWGILKSFRDLEDGMLEKIRKDKHSKEIAKLNENAEKLVEEHGKIKT